MFFCILGKDLHRLTFEKSCVQYILARRDKGVCSFSLTYKYHSCVMPCLDCCFSTIPSSYGNMYHLCSGSASRSKVTRKSGGQGNEMRHKSSTHGYGRVCCIDQVSSSSFPPLRIAFATKNYGASKIEIHQANYQNLQSTLSHFSK
jgi:hypothetical protein